MNIGDFCVQSGVLTKKVNNSPRFNSTTAIYSDWTIGGMESKPIEINRLTQLVNQIKQECVTYHSPRGKELPPKAQNFYKEAIEWFANLT